jgi:uncharacterized membrane protein YjjP (DUF1212 family)
MSQRLLHTELLLQAGRLLLEYNESTEAIHRALLNTAKALTDDRCHVTVSYRGVIVSLDRDAPALELVRELRYNTAVQVRVHAILARVRGGDLEPAEALAELDRVEADTPRHPRWLAALLLGAGAAGLARLLGADPAAVAVAGLASAVGLLARQELGRRHFSLLTLPLAATFLGAVLGGLAIRLGWTRTPDLVLIVPALMLVPGPHLINGLLDLFDNHLPMSIARLGLATGILLASALGIILGIEMTLPDLPPADPAARAAGVNLLLDMALAGVVTCSFAVFYNTAWGQVWMAVVGGMAGHGLRYAALEAGCRLEVATFLGSLAVGVVSAWMARSGRMPFAVIGFAGAVTLMPGVQIYRALAGALQLARPENVADQPAVAATFGNASQATLVVGALALGLVLGARAVQALVGARGSPRALPIGARGGEAPSLAGGRTRVPEEAANHQPQRVAHDADDA